MEYRSTRSLVTSGVAAGAELLTGGTYEGIFCRPIVLAAAGPGNNSTPYRSTSIGAAETASRLVGAVVDLHEGETSAHAKWSGFGREWFLKFKGQGVTTPATRLQRTDRDLCCVEIGRSVFTFESSDQVEVEALSRLASACPWFVDFLTVFDGDIMFPSINRVIRRVDSAPGVWQLLR
jgi:hypothetical protein